ncbi:MAG: hypothetical protein HYZ10_09820 [Ignavibacteriales bacterium]|nr:MAG: hypothetical protein FD122_425 [Stygiobacter sp.]KAF0217098.1 MAG: hypothetical protein FD178_853 [Ignavibacteria bacterium]MBI3124692.1 hypothetical protein [Ignavibacteriales bacterium]OGU68049.1 MAG: hypothetical protein A2X62_15570 [Stygiobacter sp. GWC2_38_9]OGV06555.1 MAG: hypothetical protein A2299_02525 [Stygiobacter sp. RIFOXYB2_FULL_37_11]OGV13183.1 MAG: hypothetical protein A2440_12700 [Stygiobacter sp. RIFOXYC2_FULL_38_25]OGV14675.1 MAG: hypothetical protein A2237_03580 [S
MKKYILFIFLFVVCFHDAIELKEDLGTRVAQNSMNISHYNQIDHSFESIVVDTKYKCIPSSFDPESISISPKENCFIIWKPPTSRQI